MCDFMGQDFGAAYPDSVYIDGYLAAKYAEKPLNKVREYVARMKEKWGTFGKPASLKI